jgi:hypothetical protein
MSILLSSFKDIANSLETIGLVFANTWFFLFPPFLFFLFKFLWVGQVRDREFLPSINRILLEIIPPQNIEKSPKLMESFFNGLHGVQTTIPKSEFYIKGRVIEWFSLEIVGDSGKIHFYINCPDFDKGIVEANLYAQYPDVQIMEVEDYVEKIPLILPNKKWEVWGAEAKLVDADPLPIRTYDKFQEDVTGKMIDPLSSILEVLGKLGPNQKVWYQILINPEPEGWEHEEGLKMIEKLAGRESKPDGILERLWADITDVFSNLIKALSSPVEFASKEEKKEEAPLEFRLTPGEKERLKALEENMTKNVYKTKISFVYIGKKENYDKGGVVGGFWGGMKQFGDQYSNGISIQDDTKTYAWYFMIKSRLRYRQRRLVRRYIKRDPDGSKFYLSTMELATIFHMPDMSAMSPAITRVESKLGSAPANLPIK